VSSKNDRAVAALAAVISDGTRLAEDARRREITAFLAPADWTLTPAADAALTER
jgi:hypothetical protein